MLRLIPVVVAARRGDRLRPRPRLLDRPLGAGRRSRPTAAARMPTCRWTIGDWDGTPIESKSPRASSVAGWLQRRYVQSQAPARRRDDCPGLRPARPGVDPHAGGVLRGQRLQRRHAAAASPCPASTASSGPPTRSRRRATDETQAAASTGAGTTATAGSPPTTPARRSRASPVLHKLYVMREADHAGRRTTKEPC